jgi:hypothetical protein
MKVEMSWRGENTQDRTKEGGGGGVGVVWGGKKGESGPSSSRVLEKKQWAGFMGLPRLVHFYRYFFSTINFYRTYLLL